MSSRPPTRVTLLLLYFLSFLPLGRAQGILSLALQAANPIAVRSPYLSCWFPLIYGTTWDENLLSTSDLSQVCMSLRPVAMFSSSLVTGPRMERACEYRQYHLRSPRAERNYNRTFHLCEYHRYDDHTYTNSAHHTSRAHANQSYIPQPYRGSSSVINSLHHPHVYLSKPGDFVRQSIPFSYLSVTATSLDNLAHRVQVYSDITGGARSCSSEYVMPR
jgi:hypothetical protein